MLLLIIVEAVSAATSFSNSLTSFTGNSTNPVTQAAVGIAGFNFFETTAGDGSVSNPTVAFNANGATFGSSLAGDGGRNYIRTNESDYATVSFVAEITFTVFSVHGSDPSIQQLFFGMGSGNTALYGLPDWSTQFASTFVQPQINGSGNSFLTLFRTQNDANEFVEFSEQGYSPGTHRLQMSFDSSIRKVTYAIDLNYVGGAFVSDISPRPVDLNHIDCPVGCGDPMMPISADFFAPDGWPNEPSRLYFGGDDRVSFKDFSVVVLSSPDFDHDGDIDGRDFLVWRRNPGIGSLLDWQTQYGSYLLMANSSTVPEPTAMLLLLVFGCHPCAKRYRQ